MKNSYKLTTVGTTLLLTALAGRAQAADSGEKFYVNVDAGGAFQTDIAIKNSTGFVGPGGDIKFDTGFRAGVEFGYNFNQSFSAELEAGIIRNTINQVGIQDLSSVGADAELDEIPLMVNGIYKIPLKGNFKPYVGVGVGAVVGIFDSSNIPGSSSDSNPKYSDADFTFAYQAEVGFKYELGQNAELGLVYKFIGTTDHGWKDNNIELKADGTMTHAIEATFGWRF